MPQELVTCYNLILKNEQFRCLALNLMETKLGPFELAHFLTIRLKMVEAATWLEVNSTLDCIPRRSTSEGKLSHLQGKRH